MEHIEGRATRKMLPNRKQIFVREAVKDARFQVLTFG